MKSGDLTVVVLAGGRSTRFGSDKALATRKGLTMLDAVVRVARAVSDEILISVRGPEQRYPMAGVRRVVDAYEACGPLAGIHAGLAAMKTSWLLAIACDMPLLTPDILLSLSKGRAPGHYAVVARTPDGRRHPLCACYHTAALPTVEAHLESGTLTLRTLLDSLGRVRYVDLPAGPLGNVNTPSDLSG